MVTQARLVSPAPFLTNMTISMQTKTIRHHIFFAAAVSVGWLLWNLWDNVFDMVSPAKSLPGIPLVKFDGDNSRERYVSDAGSL